LELSNHTRGIGSDKIRALEGYLFDFLSITFIVFVSEFSHINLGLNRHTRLTLAKGNRLNLGEVNVLKPGNNLELEVIEANGAIGISNN
jgi:hypothetical protein